LVSFAIPAYNHEAFVGETLRSILDQDYPNIEVVVVDDGSADRTLEIVRKTLAASPRPSTVLTQPNQGTGKTLQRAYAATQGEFVWLFSSDDVVLAGAVRKQVEAMQAKRLGARYGASIHFLPDGKEHTPPIERAIAGLEQGRLFEAACLSVSGMPLVQAGLFRRSVLESIGGLDHGYTLEDWPIFLFVAKSGTPVEVVRDPMIRYRVHPANTTRDYRRTMAIQAQVVEGMAPRRLRRRALANVYLQNAEGLAHQGKPYRDVLVKGTILRPHPLRLGAFLLRRGYARLSPRLQRSVSKALGWGSS
jgi:alpha-1,3-rhamnosyltransferase